MTKKAISTAPIMGSSALIERLPADTAAGAVLELAWPIMEKHGPDVRPTRAPD
jgi:hypothetical protein